MSDQKTPRRDFIKLATMTLGGVGAASLAIPFITSMNPGKDTLALASTEIDLSPLKEGQSLTIIWRGKPVFVKHRTPQEITDSKNTNLKTTGMLVFGLVITQISLGIVTLLLRIQIHVATTHQFIAILLLLSVIRLTYLSSEKSQSNA